MIRKLQCSPVAYTGIRKRKRHDLLDSDKHEYASPKHSAEEAASKLGWLQRSFYAPTVDLQPSQASKVQGQDMISVGGPIDAVTGD